jgi:uncharacterized RDD family membrane protein YckC
VAPSPLRTTGGLGTRTVAAGDEVRVKASDSHQPEPEGADRPLIPLLRGYRDLLEHRTPAIVWMSRGRGLNRLIRMPCLRWIARYMTGSHVRHSLAALERRYTARIALAEATPVEHDELERIKAFRGSLSPVLLAGVAITSAFTGFASLGFASVRSVLELTGLAGTLVDAYESNIGNENTWGEELMLAAMALPLAFAVVLAPAVSAFRLKRARFNLYPALDETRGQRASDHVGRATGLYGLERDAFGRLGTSPPREFPLDLAASALPTVALGALMGSLAIASVQLGLEGEPGSALVGFLWTATAVPLLVWRLRRSVRHARARTGQAPAAMSAEPARIRTRWRAQLADLPTVAAISIGIWVAAGTLFDGRDQEVLVWGAPTVAALAYAMLCLARRRELWARPLGKSRAGIAVVRADGEPVEWWRHLLREGVLKWGLFGVPALFMVGVPTLLNMLWPYVDEHNRALHDVVAGTVVIPALREEPKLAPVAVAV